jgi:hypothetical protein
VAGFDADGLEEAMGAWVDAVAEGVVPFGFALSKALADADCDSAEGFRSLDQLHDPTVRATVTTRLRNFRLVTM